MNEAGRSVDLSSAASFADSTRLIEENEKLQKRLSEMSKQLERKQVVEVGKGNANNRQEIALRDNPYGTESLDEMLQLAASLYDAEQRESKELAFACFPEPPKYGESSDQVLSLGDIFPPDAFTGEVDMKAFEATDETGTWDSSHVKLLDAYEVDPATKMIAKVEPKRLKLVEISSEPPEVVSHVPRNPRKVGPYSDSAERSSESVTISEVSMHSLKATRAPVRAVLWEFPQISL